MYLFSFSLYFAFTFLEIDAQLRSAWQSPQNFQSGFGRWYPSAGSNFLDNNQNLKFGIKKSNEQTIRESDEAYVNRNTNAFDGYVGFGLNSNSNKKKNVEQDNNFSNLAKKSQILQFGNRQPNSLSSTQKPHKEKTVDYGNSFQPDKWKNSDIFSNVGFNGDSKLGNPSWEEEDNNYLVSNNENFGTNFLNPKVVKNTLSNSLTTEKYNFDSDYSTEDSKKKKNFLLESNEGTSLSKENDSKKLSAEGKANKNKPNKKKFSGSVNNDFDRWKTTTTSKTTTTASYYPEYYDEKPFDVKPNSQSSIKGTKKKNSAFRDTSILDELDKNDWYFGKQSNFPEVDVNSNLNIDVRELWDFDSRRGLKSNFKKGSENRKSRDIDNSSICICTDVNLCNEEDVLLTKGFLNERCSKLTEVCCLKPKPNFNKEINYENKITSICGQRKLLPMSFQGGEEDMEFPWLLKLETLDGEIGCSASLIHAQLALTAAYCVAGKQNIDLVVRAGLWSSDDSVFQVRKVVRTILHPDYNTQNPRNDIALIVFDTPFEITDHVNTICLPSTNEKWDIEKCIVADWGLDKINTLRKGEVSFLSQGECQNTLLTTIPWRTYILHESFICGVEKYNRNFCLGSEGSPVMCPVKNSPETYFQIGIVSSSMNCNILGGLGIFTNVLKFIDFISDTQFSLNTLE